MPGISVLLQENSRSLELHEIMVIIIASYIFISFGSSASRTKLRSSLWYNELLKVEDICVWHCPVSVVVTLEPRLLRCDSVWSNLILLS
jgi:hypothetical protein